MVRTTTRSVRARTNQPCGLPSKGLPFSVKVKDLQAPDRECVCNCSECVVVACVTVCVGVGV